MNVAILIVFIVISALAAVIYINLVRSKRKTATIEKIHKTCLEENEQLSDEIERVKEELHLIRLKAGESDRLKSAFLMNMSHELRTPLHAIMGFAGLISNPSMPEEDKITYANIINRNVDSLLEIISDIFDISQSESGVTGVELESVNVNDLMNSLQTWINLEKSNVGKEEIVVKVNKASKDNNFCIYTDGYKLKRALNHLVYNALKYSNEGFIEIGYTFSENKLMDFYVKDDGIGFSNDKLELMFSQFRQVDETPVRQYGGLGLGLTLAQKFATFLNGKLWAESEPGNGSTFHITLPFENKN
ncbi:MAG: HAMP domain-containing sensor histidine kinase [Bacteroidales bacterium]|nr:HAMP domain-containing sensor histidine kinase [Bacteroidales bacterium]